MTGAVAVSNWSGVVLGIMCLLGIVGSMLWVGWTERRDDRKRADIEQWLQGAQDWWDDASSEED